jgi:hypothetical protein
VSGAKSSRRETSWVVKVGEHEILLKTVEEDGKPQVSTILLDGHQVALDEAFDIGHALKAAAINGGHKPKGTR